MWPNCGRVRILFRPSKNHKLLLEPMKCHHLLVNPFLFHQSRSRNHTQLKECFSGASLPPSTQYAKEPSKHDLKSSIPEVLPFDHKKGRVLTPIPGGLSLISMKFLEDNLIARVVSHPRTSIPKKFDPEACCLYHMDTSGHKTENCWPLKHIVQDLIDARVIKIDSSSQGYKINDHFKVHLVNTLTLPNILLKTLLP